MDKTHSKYSYLVRNTTKDSIYKTRLRLIEKINFDYNKTTKRYNYFIVAYLGCIIA